MAFDDDNDLMRDEIRRITAKLVVRVESVLEEPGPLSAGELDKLAGVLKDAASVLGLRAPLDEEEQRAKIGVLLARADGGAKGSGVVRIEFGEGVEELAK